VNDTVAFSQRPSDLLVLKINRGLLQCPDEIHGFKDGDEDVKSSAAPVSS
jgi:hypothetical protein